MWLTILKNFYTNLVQYRLAYALITLAIMMVGATQISDAEFNGDINVIFDSDDPYLLRSQELERTYETSQYLMLLVKPADGEVFSPGSLEQIRSLTQQATLLPYSIRVDSLTNFQHVSVDGDELSVAEALPYDTPITPGLASDVRAQTMAEDRIWGKLVSAKEDVAAVIVTLALPENRLDAVVEATDAAEKLRDELENQSKGTRLWISGDIAIERAMLDVTIDDMVRVVPLVLLTIFVLTGIFLRSATAVLATVGVVICSVVISVGLLVYLGFKVDPVTMMAPAIIMILAVLDSIHILTQYMFSLSSGKQPHAAMTQSLKENAKPVFWTSFTTAIGFLGLNFGDSPPFRDLGNMSAIGVMCAFLCTYTVLPALALIHTPSATPKPFLLSGLMRKVAESGKHISMPVLIIVFLIVAYLFIQIPKLNVNDDVTEYFDESLGIHAALQHSREHIQGVEYIAYSMDSNTPGGVNDPDFLNKVDAFSEWLRSQPEVESVDSYVSLIKSIHQAMNEDDPAFNKIPDQRDVIAQYMLLYELALPVGSGLSSDLSVDRSSLRLTVNLTAGDNSSLIGLERKADKWLEEHYPELQNRAVSQMLMFAHLGNNIIYSMIDGSLVTFVLVTLMMVIGLQSWRYGLMSMLPNLCPPVVVYGVWSILVGEVNQAAAMTFSMCLGLVVDDTVHIVSKYLDKRRSGLAPEEAVTSALVHSGTAVVITSITLSLGILLLSLSNFTVNVTLSYMLVWIIVVALLFDLIILPRLLVRFDSGKAANTSHPA